MCSSGLAITAGLMPLLALIFHEISLASPLANAYAIPIISLIVTPLALLSAGAAAIPGLGFVAAACAWLGHAALDLMMTPRSEEQTSELQSLMRISYAGFCLKKKNHN